ncbi:hypothetical protein MBLNU457_6245t1 [Dothideomycetes sp. NU457]
MVHRSGVRACSSCANSRVNKAETTSKASKGTDSKVTPSSPAVDSSRQQEQDARNSILSQVLEPSAADRLGRIRLVKASRAEDVENRLIMLARSGQLRQKVTEEQLKDILAQLSEQQEKKEQFSVQRRKGGWDDDDLDDLLNDV